MTRTAIEDSDREEVARFIERHWGSTRIISLGKAYYPHEHEGFIERREGKIAGLLSMRTDEDSLEILTVNSVVPGERIGTSLILAAIEEARRRSFGRVWLTTTNDNMKAIGLHQRLGFRMVEVHVGAVDAARKIKPQIPETGRDGIPIHDEIVLECKIKPYTDSPA